MYSPSPIVTGRSFVKDLPGYLANGWVTLQTDVKAPFGQPDKPQNTISALREVVHEAITVQIDFIVHILRCSSITEALSKQGTLSTLRRISLLLDGFSHEYREGFSISASGENGSSRNRILRRVNQFTVKMLIKDYVLQTGETGRC